MERSEQNLEVIVVELLCVVRDDNLENAKLTNNILPYKIVSISFSDFGKRFCVYPLYELVYGND